MNENINNIIQKFGEIILTSKKEDAVEILSKYTDGNTFAHFSSLEGRFGFNPKYQHDTPFGIYGYIITEDFIKNLIQDTDLFAIDRKYIHIFRAKTRSNLLNITDISEEEYNVILDKIKKLFPQEIYNHTIWTINRAISIAYKDTFSSKIWSIIRLFAKMDAKQWTKLLQKLGYDGVIDYGSGTIYSAEPSQAVIFVGNEELITTIDNKIKKDYRKIFDDMKAIFNDLYSKIKEDESGVFWAGDKLKNYINKSEFIEIKIYKMFNSLVWYYANKLINDKDITYSNISGYVDIIINILADLRISSYIKIATLMNIGKLKISDEEKNKINNTILRFKTKDIIRVISAKQLVEALKLGVPFDEVAQIIKSRAYSRQAMLLLMQTINDARKNGIYISEEDAINGISKIRNITNASDIIDLKYIDKTYCEKEYDYIMSEFSKDFLNRAKNVTKTVDIYGDITYRNELGQMHREDGPAIIRKDGSKEWLINGKRHREDGPAVENSDGSKYWHINGGLHREDGPAVILPSGKEEYWLYNNQYTKEDFEAIRKSPAFMKYSK